MSYQESKTKDYGVNNCEGCLSKQRQGIDRWSEEIKRLKQKLKVNQRKREQGFFVLSTPSLQIPVKADSLEENSYRQF